MKQLFFLLVFIFNSFFLFSQENDTVKTTKTNRLVIIGSGITVGYFSSLYMLNEAWYKNYPKSNFHFFNDNKEWLQMDKLGHFSTAYTVSNAGFEMFKWAGVKEKSAVWLGAGVGSLYMRTIEILDGFSAQWGASPGDLLANTMGSCFSIIQNKSKKSFVELKWSFHPTKYANLRPNLLGENIPQRMIKDYNGQTYWLSFNLKQIVRIEKIPNWLNIAFGYGAEGMLGGDSNPLNYNGKNFSFYKRSRQYYFSLDVCTKNIKTKRRILKTVFDLINVVKIPMPTLEFEKNNLKFYPLYF